ncbi:MAG TPA: hypothetical protein VE986_04215 [Hyphomicrobiales bacterium]|nr:hypothetical protein [Hyphomicrobiales bacterium]
MYRYNGRILKTLQLPAGGRVDIVARADGSFRFYERGAGSALDPASVRFESGSYISAESAEAAARLRFKL